MSESVPITDMTVEDVLRRWPQTAEVFGRRNMACIGCPVAPFYTIAEAAAVYNLPLADFVTELQRSIVEDAVQE